MRKLILGERIMYADGVEPVNCVFTVSLRGALSRERLVLALLMVQQKHPLLQARILRRRGRPYFEVDGVPEIGVREVDRSSDTQWLEVTDEEWERPFDMEYGPLARVVWIRSEMGAGLGSGSASVSELMLVCPHCICDGGTGVTLMREILLLLDRPEEEIGSYVAFRSLKEIVPPGLWSQRWKGYLKSWFVRLFFLLKPIGPKGGRGKNFAIRWRLDESSSSALIDRCKSEGVTVHAALCVAFLEAYHAKNKVICPVDIRRYVREIRKDMMFAFAPIVEMGMKEGTFWERCRLLKEELTEKMAAIKAYELLLHSEYYHPAAKRLVKWLCADAGTHDFTFSNMGRLDLPERYDTFSVEAVYSPTVAFPWKNPTTIVVSSFGGRMDFAYVSNSGYVRYTEAMDIKERSVEILREAIAVASQSPTVVVRFDSR
ncbi:MAG: hypothetical protein JST68_02585 [Bacteroidetes bacterium]|nr:hypothetical protein [Bacteroidota bacterium]